MVLYPDEGKVLKITRKRVVELEPRKEVIIRLKRPKKSKTPFVIAGIFAFLLLIALTSARPQNIVGTKQIIETYTDHEPRYINQDANVTEFYHETEKFSGATPCVYKPLGFEQNFNYKLEIMNGSLYLRCTLQVKNLEQKTGEWKYFAVVQKPDSSEFETNTIAKNITGNETAEFLWLYQLMSWDNYACKVRAESIPSDWKCDADVVSVAEKERTVERKKTVTVIVDVQKTRNVTKEMNETVYLNRVFGYEQPFWLGY